MWETDHEVRHRTPAAPVRVLDAVGVDPGVTSTRIAATSGLAASTVAHTLDRLHRIGAVTRRGTGAATRPYARYPAAPWPRS